MDHEVAARELLILRGVPFEGERARVLEALAALVLAGNRPSLSAAAEAGGVPKGTAAAWVGRHEDFREAVGFLRSQTPAETPEATFQAIRRRIIGEDDVTVPDFLTFRDRHFAYVGRDGRVRRAVNNWFQVESARHLDSNKRLLLYLPPGSAKTTLFGVERPTWELFRSRNFRATVISKNEGEASKITGATAERMDHPYYHWLAEQLERQGDEPITCPVCVYTPDLPFVPESKDRGAKWGAHAFRVVGRTGGEKDDSFQARGVGSQLQGIRSDYIVLDDVQDPMDAYRSPKDSEDKLEWLRTVVLGRIYPHQRLVVCANRTSPDDFAGLLEQTFPDWPLVKFPAVLPCQVEDCPGGYDDCAHTEDRVLVPELWDFDGLMAKRKEVGDRTWFWQWAMEEGDFEGRTFQRETLEASRTEDYRLGEVPFDVTDTFIGVDPAVAASGVCAIVAWGLDRRTKRRYLIDIFAEKGLRTWSNVVDEIVAMAQRLSASQGTFRSVVIERAGTQEALIQDDRLNKEIRSLYGRVVEYKTRTGSGASAIRDNFDITTLGTLFEGGLIALPYAGTYAEREKVDALVSEFLAWRVGDDGRSIKHLKRDRVMAVLFAESEAFLEANRVRERKPRPRQDLPLFVRERNAVWNHQRQERRERAEARRARRAERMALGPQEPPEITSV